MRLTLKKIVILVLAIYLVITCYTGYTLLRTRYHRWFEYDSSDVKADYKVDTTLGDDSWNPWGDTLQRDNWRRPIVPPLGLPFEPFDADEKEADNIDEGDNIVMEPGNKIVEIWGKAAISNYLWEHILDARLEKKLGGIWSFGTKKIDNIVFRFRTGPGLVPVKAPQDVEHLVIVLNGREDPKVEYATMWLDFLKTLPNLVNVALVLLGDEMCLNSWVDKYLFKQGGLVKAAFVVYDSKEVNDVNFFQWPLGVATYRGFPAVKMSDVSTKQKRQYQCNFLGTVYSGSSREVLVKVIHDNNLNKWCYINPRDDWLPGETEETREEYYHALLQSDFTLNPVGKNTECYRIYEAMSYGSIPIVEDVMTPGNCGNNSVNHQTPLSLLKKYGAPVLYIKDWHELPSLLIKYRHQSSSSIVQWRLEVLEWYNKFKTQIRDHFIHVVKSKFNFN